MKINYIKLKNFSAIHNAQNTHYLEVDFSGMQNKICLLIGPNGSGKTSFLSMLHPFSDVGNLDVRNGNKLILSEKEGYKEIQIQKDEDKYTIKHYYTPQKDKNHSIKSFIEKNGIELNSHGNVSSFKEIVREELLIEPEYLKLIRLGKNVTSMIDLTATERKNFMGKIMDEIGIYLDYYKSTNIKLRQLSEMISHTVDKEKRLGIIDKGEYKKEINKLERELKHQQDLFLTENNRLAVLKNIFNGIEDRENISFNLKTINKKYNKMMTILEKKNSLNSLDYHYYEELLKKYENDIMTKKNEIGINLSLLDNSLSHMDTLQEQLRSYTIQIEKELDSDQEIKRMEENLLNLKKRMIEYEDIIGNFKPAISKKDISDFIIFLKNMQYILNRTYEFGKRPIEKVITLIRNKKNVMNYINSHLMNLDEEKEGQNNSIFMSSLAKYFMNDENKIDCSNECPAKNLYYQVQNLLKNSEVEDRTDSISFYRDMELVYNNLCSIIPKFSEYKELIILLPEDIKKDFITEKIYDNIIHLRNIFNEAKLNDLLSITTEYENYQELMIEYNSEQNIIEKISSTSNSSHFNKQIKKTKRDIEELKGKMLNWKNRNIELQEEIQELERTTETTRDIKETLEKYDEVKELKQKIQDEYDVLTKTISEINFVESNISKIKSNIDAARYTLQQKQMTLLQYKDIRKEISQMNLIYEDMLLVKNSLSSKEGMPIKIFKRYLDDVVDITNELLDIAYNGKIRIDTFELSATEFSIPFYNKGIRLDDVKYASQGELSFLNTALAFALSRQKLIGYNIMLLDEVDGELDECNREKFIQIINRQEDEIEAEQGFLITHNRMFNMYPVDVLDFSFENDSSEYPLANFIKIKKGL